MKVEELVELLKGIDSDTEIAVFQTSSSENLKISGATVLEKSVILTVEKEK